MKKYKARGLAALIGLAFVTQVSAAGACGGLFCSAAQPVNQAAERIIFANNGDGTVTAVIQILYEGPASSFSWLLPISTVPTGDTIQVSSDLAFERLQQATNPQYLLNTRTEGLCADDFFGGDDVAEADGDFAGEPAPEEEPVQVVGSGNIGPFDWTAISVQEGTEAPADAAVEWLEMNDYFVPEGSAALLGPYLEDGMYLLALRLNKDADTGSIRPIVLTYDAARPMIPIKLTAVAANEDMGVMTWLLGDGRGVPENYLELELNEARINWLNPGSNYGQVVNDAADDAGGQGFVTEYAQATSMLDQVVWADWEEDQWDTFSSTTYGSFQEAFDNSYYQWGQYDGFWDAVTASVTLPEQVSEEDFRICPTCYSEDVEFSPAAFFAALEAEVVEPMRLTQELIDSQLKVTRLYSTLSADEMTLDPLFTFNPDLPDVSNVHTADRVIECNENIERSAAPWRIELPQGGQVRGVGQGWPSQLADLAPNRMIKRQGASGSGKVIEDNAAAIEADLAAYNESVPSGLVEAGSEATSSEEPEEDSVTGNSADDVTEVGIPEDDAETSEGDEPSASGTSVEDASESDEEAEPADDDGGCALSAARHEAPAPSALNALLSALFGLALFARRRRG